MNIALPFNYFQGDCVSSVPALQTCQCYDDAAKPDWLCGTAKKALHR